MSNSSVILDHYPPQLVTFITEVLPIIYSKRQEILSFFESLNVPEEIIADIKEKISKKENSISKYMLIRTVLYRLNNNRENSYLRERYMILKRLVELNDFSTCWPDTIDKAKSIAAKIRETTRENSWLKDMEEALEEKKELPDEIEEDCQFKLRRTFLKNSLTKVLSEQDEIKRAKDLASIMNHLFGLYEIPVAVPFKKEVLSDEGLIEHIDGVVQINKDKYLVEVKWALNNLGDDAILKHFMSIYYKEQTKGILISVNGYRNEAVDLCRRSLERVTVVLCKLEEIVTLLSMDDDLNTFFQKKINEAIRDRNPLYEPLEPLPDHLLDLV